MPHALLIWQKKRCRTNLKKCRPKVSKTKGIIGTHLETNNLCYVYIYICMYVNTYLSLIQKKLFSNGMSVSAPRAAHLATETMSHEPKKMSSEIVKNKKVSYNAIDKQSLYTYISINTYLSLIQKTFSQTACPLVPHARLIEQQKRCRTNLKNSRPKLSKSKQYVYMYIYI